MDFAVLLQQSKQVGHRDRPVGRGGRLLLMLLLVIVATVDMTVFGRTVVVIISIGIIISIGGG